MRDFNGGLLPASCVQYQPYDGGPEGSPTVMCDGTSQQLGSLPHDSIADGYVEILNLDPGKWFIVGNEVGDTLSTSPLPQVLDVQADQATNGYLVFHQSGGLEARIRGNAGQLVSGCVRLSWDWHDVGGDTHQPYGEAYLSDAGRACDADDGARDGVVHFPQLASGTYWAVAQSSLDSPQTVGSFSRFQIAQGSTKQIDLYFPSAKLSVNVYDADTNERIPNITLEFFQYVDSSYQEFIVRGDSDSVHPVTATLPPGTYRVATRDQTGGEPNFYYPGELDNVILNAPSQQLSVDLYLNRKSYPTPTRTPKPTQTTTPTPSSTPTKTPTPTVTPTQGPATRAACSIDPSSGNVRSTVILTCVGFGRYEGVALYWDTTNSVPLTGPETNEIGELRVAFAIPSLTKGNHTLITVGQKSGKHANKTFTVKSSLSLAPKTGAGGTTVKATAYGFATGETISLRWWNTQGTSYQTVKTGLVASSTGQVTGTFVIAKGQAVGKHLVEAVGNKKSKASTNFTLTVSAFVMMASEQGAASSAVFELRARNISIPSDAVLTSEVKRRIRGMGRLVQHE
jgi:hypothetical protein